MSKGQKTIWKHTTGAPESRTLVRITREVRKGVATEWCWFAVDSCFKGDMQSTKDIDFGILTGTVCKIRTRHLWDWIGSGLVVKA